MKPIFWGAVRFIDEKATGGLPSTLYERTLSAYANN